MRLATAHIETIAARLVALDVPRLSLSGGLAPHIVAFLSATTRARLVPPRGDALDGALLLARASELASAA
jgi:glucosamine kinase